MTRAEHGPWAINGIENRLCELHGVKPEYSFWEIARMLSAEFGVTLTKNAIAGRVHRLCLPLRQRPKKGPPYKRKSRAKQKTEMIVMKEEMPIMPLEPRPEGTIPLLELRDDVCHWPFGEHPHVTYCGQPLFYRSYCCEHFNMGYVRARRTWE